MKVESLSHFLDFLLKVPRNGTCEMNFQNPEETAIEGIKELKNFLSSIGMPINFHELGAKEEDIPYLVDTLCCGNNRPGYIEGYVKLTKEDCTNIYNLML